MPLYGAKTNLEAIEMAPVLVIDDIGAQMAKDWVNTAIFKLIDKRYSNKLVTIYTSNKRIQELNMDERIIDRIQSQSLVVEFPEVPIRQMEIEKKHAEFEKRINGGTTDGTTV